MDSSPSKRRRTSPSTFIAVTVESTNNVSLSQDGTNPSRRRSSFMAPTKASLARFYPSLLPRAKSAEPSKHISLEVHGAFEQRPAVSGGTNGPEVYIAGTASRQLESGVNGVEERHELLMTPRQSSQSSEEVNTSAQEGDYMISPDPRASPPEEARRNGTGIDGTSGRQQEPVTEITGIENSSITVIPDSQKSQLPSAPMQLESHVPTSGMGIGEDGEPSLPSTPSQLGLEPPLERPKGLLFSSPTRRLRRKGRSSTKSSPLKSRDALPEHSHQKPKASVANFGPRRYIANTPKLPPPPEEIRLAELQKRLDDVEKQLRDTADSLLRQLLVSSWQQDRGKEERDMAKQRKEVIQRSTYIVQLRDEVQRMRTVQRIEVIPEVIEQKIASLKTHTLTQRLAKFLPFYRRPHPPEPRFPSPKHQDVNRVLDLETVQSAVAPFIIAISNRSLPPSTANNDLLQRQDVMLSTSQQALKCDLQLTITLNAQQTTKLDVQALSSWAESELGSWLREPRENMEVEALGRAFGRYWEVAKLRGKCWVSCKQEFANLVANVPESNSPLLYYGMQDLILARSNVQLKLTWRISLSDGGEVESHSSACPRFPAAWQQEANSELTKIGDAYMMLVEDRGIFEAIMMICKGFSLNEELYGSETHNLL